MTKVGMVGHCRRNPTMMSRKPSYWAQVRIALPVHQVVPEMAAGVRVTQQRNREPSQLPSR